MKLDKTILTAGLAIAATSAFAQVAMMPPHLSTFTGSTRGYFFTAPVAFTMTGIQVLLPPGSNNTFMNFAVVRFDGAVPPPAFPGTTNAFTQLALGLDVAQGAFAPINVVVNAGDLIGVYGNTTPAVGGTSGANSYGNGGLGTTIGGNNVILNRSGMQFHLGSVTSPSGMHDLWTEGTGGGNITRVEFEYTVIPEPATIVVLALGGLGLLLRRRKA